MTDFTGHLRASLWWLVPLVALAVLIGWETGWGKAFARRPAPPEAITPKPVVASLLPEYAIPGGAAAHPEMVQRTLFNPTRRPAPPAPDVSAAGRLQRGQFALTGTLVIDGKSTAYLREVQGNKARRVLAGDKVNGMLVAEVRPDRVKLTLGDESEELLLKVGTNPRPTVPPPVAQVAAAPAAVPAGSQGVPQGATVPGGATPAQASEPTQTLAERRRAARAAALEQQQQSAAAQGAPTAATAPATATPGASPAGVAPSGVLDPRWNRTPRGTTR